MEEPRIAIAASPREWAQRLHRHVTDHGGALVRATVLHPSDALAEEFDVFVVDDCTSFLSRRLVDELHRRGRSVLGVFDPEDPRGKGDLLDLGVDEIVPRSDPPEQFVLAITELRTRNRRPVDSELHALVAELSGSGVQAPAHTTTENARPIPLRTTPDLHPGRVTVIGGAGGGVGATEVAIGLTSCCAGRGDTTALVDADDVAPAIAQRLGLPPYPNLRAAVDALDHRETGIRDLLIPLAKGRFAVLPGLSTPTGWADLRPLEVGEVVTAVAAIRRHVTVNVGPRLEDVHTLGAASSRYAVSRHLLGLADTIVAVALPTPVGLARLLAWLTDARSLAPSAPIHIVFNRAPSSAFKRGEVFEELTRTFTPAGVWFAPYDPRVEEAAWAGTLASGGPFAKAIAAAVDAILPTTAAVSTRRRLQGTRA